MDETNDYPTPDLAIFITEEEKVQTFPDYSKLYILPAIKTRYLSILIDTIVILLVSLGISAIIESAGEVSGYVRGTLFILIIFLYEPVLVSINCTIGQMLVNIRCRDFSNPENKLPFYLVLVRFVLKLLLGWLSFITVTFNINRRAIHDFASNSIMISNKIENKTV